MPNPSKGARLWLRPAAGDRKATWIIRDGAKQSSTGCGADDLRAAEQSLRRYLATKHRPSIDRLDPRSIPVADVIRHYATDKGRYVARPAALIQRLHFLLGFWGQSSLSDVTPAECRRYAGVRGEQAARRELEDLRAAVRHHWKLGYCDRETRVTLPEKAIPRDRWLTRKEAAKLIRAALKHEQRRHLARFILVGLYTGTRSGAICTAAYEPAPGRGFVDLDHGVFYRLPKGKRQTNKRQPSIRIPSRLLVHMRRWRRLGARSVIEYEGLPVGKVVHGFTNLAASQGLTDVTPHTLRHTAITWAMQNGADIYQAAGFFGVSPEVLIEVYGHHHPDHQAGVADAVTRRPAQVRHRFTRTKGEDRPHS